MPKKRANGEGSIRKKPNGRWEGRYTQGIDPVTGRAIQKSVSARTQAECKEKLARAIRDNRGIPMNHNEDYTVAKWCRLWFETYSKPVIRPNTAKTYANAIENHIIPALGGIKLKRLTSIQIQQLYNDSRTNGRVQRWESQTNTALTGSSVRRIHMVLSSALKQAVKERLIPYNPCDNCRIPPKEKKEMTILPPEKLGAYLREAEQYGVLPMFFLELSSGLRRGELLALRWDDLNVKDRILSVSKQVTRIDGELVQLFLERMAVTGKVGEWKQKNGVPVLDAARERRVIAAKTAEGLRVMNQKIKDRELNKYYLCVVQGRMTPPKGKLEGFLFKDEVKKQVYVRSKPVPGAKTAVTLYRTLAVRNGLSLVECELVTGRTHQIRAQFSASGHPLLGDGKYGSERDNRRYGRHGQALYSYRLSFRFTTDAGPLEPLNGRSWQVEEVDFVQEYFPGFSLPRTEG